MAIIHIAIFDSMNAIERNYQGYTNVQSYHNPISEDVAVAQAAHDTLAALYPSQVAAFNARLAEDLAQENNTQKRTNGINLGHRVAKAIMTMRVGDGSEVPEPGVGVDFFPSDQPGHWRQDPISQIPLALGAHWGACVPFMLTSSQQFPCPAPPA